MPTFQSLTAGLSIMLLLVSLLLVSGCQSMSGISGLTSLSSGTPGLPQQSEPDLDFADREVTNTPAQTASSDDDWDSDW